MSDLFDDLLPNSVHRFSDNNNVIRKNADYELQKKRTQSTPIGERRGLERATLKSAIAKETNKTDKIVSPLENQTEENETNNEHDAYSMINFFKNENTILQNIENACVGNGYLSGMILGEILNKPKFKNIRRPCGAK